MEARRARSFYRVTRKVPPDDASYLTRRDKYPIRPPGVSDEEWNAWGALSFYDSEDAARRRGEQSTHLGNKIVRYDIPEGVGVAWDEPDDEGHVNVWGDKEVIRNCLDPDWVALVKRAARPETKGQP